MSGNNNTAGVQEPGTDEGIFDRPPDPGRFAPIQQGGQFPGGGSQNSGSAGQPDGDGGTPDGQIIPPSVNLSQENQGDPGTGTAYESDEDLINRLANASGQMPPGDNHPGDGRRVNGQGGGNELRAELDRVKAQLNALQEDALIGQQVRNNPSLLENFNDLVQGGNNAQQPSINEVIGVDDDFVPIPEDFNTPGTKSHEWYRESVRREAADVVERELNSKMDQREQQRMAEYAKMNFIKENGTEAWQELLAFMDDPRNFDLQNMYNYMRLNNRMQERARGAPQGGHDAAQVVRARDRHTPSVAQSPSGAVSRPNPALQIQARLLQRAKQNGPF